MDHIRSVGIRACLSTILSPVLEESPRSQGSEAEDGRARPKSRVALTGKFVRDGSRVSRVEKTAAESNSRTMLPDLVDGIIGCTPRNAHECVSSVIVGVR